MLNELTSSQWEDLAAGRGRLVFRTASGSRARRPDPTDSAATGLAAAVAEINRLTSPAAVADYLARAAVHGPGAARDRPRPRPDRVRPPAAARTT